VQEQILKNNASGSDLTKHSNIFQKEEMEFQNQDLHTVTVSIDNETDTAINELY
jgi:hypothetical protein